ncbi:permease prefix domain 1-containing protein [Paenibacillus sp. P26]|nr:permease prefix domain 1-containing protein [Paenibacillus sp. P26]UUZ90961.1 permease prefix domain 1-containing protein [Paenibacillus sp. P25]
MKAIDRYLNRILKYSFLTNREKAEWKEEMSAHLECLVEDLIAQGHERSNAERITMNRFGDPGMLRNNLAKETYGFRITTILALAASLLLIFLYSFVSAVMINHASPVSPSLPLTLLTATCFLLKTRRRRDRLGLLIAIIPYGFNYIMYKLHAEWADQLHYTIVYVVYSNLSASSLAYLMTATFGLGFGIFLLTRNSWISSLPLLLSAGYCTLPMIKRLIHYIYFSAAGMEELRRYNLSLTLSYLDNLAIRLFVVTGFILFIRYLIQIQSQSKINVQNN